MKKSSDLLGLPVVSITDGAEIGRVKEIILNPVKAEIMGLVVQDDCWWKEAKVVSFALIYGIGEYAVTIENMSTLALLSSMPDYESLLQKKVHVKGSQVITRSGRLIGMVSEYYVDTKTGKLEGYEIQPSGEVCSSSRILKLPSFCVLTLGKNIVVVSEDVEDHLTETDIECKESKSVRPNGTPPVSVAAHKTSSASDDTPVHEPHAHEAEITTLIEEPEPAVEQVEQEEKLFESISFPEEQEPVPAAPVAEEPVVLPQTEEPATAVTAQSTTTPAPAAEEPAKKAQDLSKIFEERQKKFLLGKKTSRPIEAPDGMLIAGEGEVITEDVISRAKAHGKFMELSISVKMD